MKQLTIPVSHKVFFEEPELLKIYAAGLVSLFNDEIPEPTGRQFLDDALKFVGEAFYTTTAIEGIPAFINHDFVGPKLYRYIQLSKGYVPANGIGHGYKDIVFKPIQTLTRDYLNTLAVEVTSKIKEKKDGEYRSWLEYLMVVLEYCSNKLSFK